MRNIQYSVEEKKQKYKNHNQAFGRLLKPTDDRLESIIGTALVTMKRTTTLVVGHDRRLANIAPEHRVRYVCCLPASSNSADPPEGVPRRAAEMFWSVCTQLQGLCVLCAVAHSLIARVAVCIWDSGHWPVRCMVRKASRFIVELVGVVCG